MLQAQVFDAADGTARLLRFRSGHAAPPTVVRYYGDAGTRLLSAGGASRQCAAGSEHHDKQRIFCSLLNVGRILCGGI